MKFTPLGKLIRAVEFEIEIMGDKADYRQPKHFHTIREMLEFSIDCLNYKITIFQLPSNLNDIIRPIEKIQLEMPIGDEWFEYKLRLIRLIQRIRAEYRNAIEYGF
jgi:hypothetical protein